MFLHPNREPQAVRVAIKVSALADAMRSLGHHGIERAGALALQFLDYTADKESTGGAFYRRPSSCGTAGIDQILGEPMEVSRSYLLEQGLLPVYFDGLADLPSFKYTYRICKSGGLRSLLSGGSEIEMPVIPLRGLGNFQRIATQYGGIDYESVLRLAFRRFLVGIELVREGGVFCREANELYLHREGRTLEVVRLNSAPGIEPYGAF